MVRAWSVHGQYMVSLTVASRTTATLAMAPLTLTTFTVARSVWRTGDEGAECHLPQVGAVPLPKVIEALDLG